jgi:hypothetical protein
MRIDDRQLDEALRTIAVPPAPLDLPARALDQIREGTAGRSWSNWRPALGVALGVMAITLIAVWMRAPLTPREAQGSRHMAQGAEPSSPLTSARSHPRTPAPLAPQGSRRMAQGSEATHLGTSAPRQAQGARRMAQGGEPRMPQGPEDLPALDPPEPLTIARLETPELSKNQLHVNALHIPALEIETLER